ncbi:MAG TPA: metallophosphoesterase family protein [Opitutaceae bacterium]|nr:metallophosphoesterase family protein [Opitutaceae bacterium]
MAKRTLVVGDIHGEIFALERVLSQFPSLDENDTVVFLGDYLDRGPDSAAVISRLRTLPQTLSAQVVCLRGNHEDAWLRVCEEGWDEFVLPPAHGCLATLRSFTGSSAPVSTPPSDAELTLLTTGKFFPDEVITWMDSLPFWYEDDHGIYVHAGLPRADSEFLHPRHCHPPAIVAWRRTEDFVRNYHGKRILFGHTNVTLLPPELSTYTPDDPADLWESEYALGLDTGCGMGGFLTAIELPEMRVFESR